MIIKETDSHQQDKMNPPDHERIVLAYAESKYTPNHVLITLALYDNENKKWLDMMRHGDTNINVLYWEDIKDPPNKFKWATSLSMYKYRTIYKNDVVDK